MRSVDRPADVSLDLRPARIGTLGFGRESWPPAGKLLLHGLVYETLDDQNALDDRTWIAWLRLQPERPFRPQPYEQLAAVLRSNGQDTDSKHVQYAKEIDRARRSNLSWSQVAWYRIFGPLIGYGYKPWRAFWMSVAVVLLGSVLFGVGAKYGLMIPTKSEAFETMPDGTRVVSPDYPKIDPLMFSLDAFTPLISLDQAEYWRPAANRGATLDVGPVHVTAGQLLQWFLWFHVISGWVLSTLLFVGLTGTVPGT